jgi:hypothetical protein
MKLLIWFATVALAGVWSLLCWGAHVLIGYSGGVVARNADVVPWLPPELVELTSWLAIVGTNVGEWAVIAIWALGVVVLLVLGGVGSRLVGRRRQRI